MPRKSAALAFYTGFSLAPTVLLLVLLFGLVVDTAYLREQIVAQANGLFGGDAGELIGGMLEKADHPDAGLSAVFAILGLVLGATTTFAELKDGLDDVLAEKPPKVEGVWATIRARVLSFGVFLSIGFLLIVSLGASAALAVLSDVLGRVLHAEAEVLGKALSAVIGFVGVFLLFLGIYRFLPERKLSRRALLIGAVASTVLFEAGRLAIGLYLGNTDTIGAFGAAGSLAVILIWVYYSSLAFYTGGLIGRLAEEGVQAAPSASPEEDDASTPPGRDRASATGTT